MSIQTTTQWLQYIQLLKFRKWHNKPRFPYITSMQGAEQHEDKNRHIITQAPTWRWHAKFSALLQSSITKPVSNSVQIGWDRLPSIQFQNELFHLKKAQITEYRSDRLPTQAIATQITLP